MKSLEQFLLDYLGKSKGYPTDKEYLGECLSIAKIYIKECFGIEPPPSGTNSAYGYWSNFPNPLGTVFEKVKNTDDLIPEKGWVGIMEPWDGNPYGHIFIVADGSTKSICKNWAQNWSSKTFQLESNRYTNVVGFLKPKESIIEDMTEDEKRALELLESYKIANKHGNLEGAVNALVGASNDLKNKTKEIEILQNNIKALEAQLEAVNSKVAELEAKFVENQKNLDICQSKLTTANSKIDKLNETISNITEEKNTWQTRYNNKNTEFNYVTEKFDNLSKLFEEYKKCYPETPKKKFNLINFIKSLFKK
jgi:hypothetical protein